jgi:hypothetical protein
MDETIYSTKDNCFMGPTSPSAMSKTHPVVKFIYEGFIANYDAYAQSDIK